MGGLSRHSLRALEAVWNDLLALGESVVDSLEKCVLAVREGRVELVAEIKEQEEDSDRREVEIEQEALRILALFEPVATDLRRMATVLKVNRDWERIADLSLRVARRARKLVRKHPEIVVPDGIKDLAGAVLEHVRAAQGVLTRGDSAAARQVIADDQKIDDAYRDVRRELKALAAADPARLDGWLLVLSSARNLERIADHATGIAQTVVFLQEGRIIRHGDETV